MSDEYEDTYTASDYWEDMYEETMLHVKYLLETPREEAQRIFEAHLEDLSDTKKEHSQIYRFFYKRGRSLDELAYLMMYAEDRKELQH